MQEASIVGSAVGQHKDPGAMSEFKNGNSGCHSSNIDEEFECVTFTDGVICVEIKGEQGLLKIAMANDNLVDIRLTEPSRTEPIAETKFSRPCGEEDSEKIRQNHSTSTAHQTHDRY
jgi:hypothetical protein